ncbi:MAG: hypothetical protein MAG794_01241 [Gammaproteobacteria bacterium]|nr:hypothetical protein [Gammaproteobacteria bacterium]
MAKTHVIVSDDNTRVPFLRGILTRSLQDAGLSFEAAYRLSSKIRTELGDTEVLSTQRLRALVVSKLEALDDPQIVENYSSVLRGPESILIHDEDGQTTPFSRYRLQQRLECCGLSGDATVEVAQLVHDYLLEQGTSEILSRHLGGLTYTCLKRQVGEAAAQRYLTWTNFIHTDTPLILLIGGTAGCGKSTIATEVTGRLDIVRTQSTDMLREVMRMMIPGKLLPVLHESSFNAGQALNIELEDASLLKAGYFRQAELVSVACEAVLQRALREQISLVLEGVHIGPAVLNAIPDGSRAVIVPIMLAVLKKDVLRKRIIGRGRQVVSRRSERYLESFDSIWKLQSLILDEADRAAIPIVTNEDKRETVQQVMTTIVDSLAPEYVATPKEVFARSHDGRGDTTGKATGDLSSGSIKGASRKPPKRGGFLRRWVRYSGRNT